MESNDQLFEWVPFDEVWQALVNHFASDDFFEVSKFPYGPNPETIYRLVNNKYGPFDLERIPDWENYEYGKKDYTNDFFIEKLFKDLDLKEVAFFFIIVNKCFTERKVLKVRGINLRNFINLAPELIKYHIFQPCDVLFIPNAGSAITVLDHNGYYLSVPDINKI